MSAIEDLVRKVASIEKTLNAYVTQDRVSRSLNKGWIKSAYTWVYASATSFTIAGVDVTGTFTPGTRIKYNDGSIDYGIVASSSFSTNTTVNLISNNDYSIANATLTECYYSYCNPPDFHYWFAYTPVPSGFSANPTMSARFAVEGRMCTIFIYTTGAGTSNANTFTLSSPVFAAGGMIYYGVVGDWAGAPSTNLVPQCRIPNGSNIISLFLYGSAWNTSGNKYASLTIIFPI